MARVPSGLIKNIQRGTIAITGSDTSNTATITSVNTAKSDIDFLGTEHSAGDATDFGRVALTNATTVTATRATGGAPTSATTTVGFQVTEYY